MKCAIITIGDEIVDGFTIDTNSSWIAQQLINFKEIVVHEKLSIRDDQEIIQKTFLFLVEKKYKYIFVTGGLGPTKDDVTKTAILNFLNSDFLFDNKYYLSLTNTNNKSSMNQAYKDQANIIKGTNNFENSIGSARGISFTFEKTKFYVFPGFSNEMKKMFYKEIINKELKHLKNERKNITINTFGAYESTLSNLLDEYIKKSKNKYYFSFLPSYTGVKIRIKKNKNISSDSLVRYSKKIFTILQPYSYGYDEEGFNHFIVKKLSLEGRTLSVAESCTSGLLGKFITDVPGSSKIFLGGVIAYSNIAKKKLLGINDDLIKEHGAVSRQVVKEMASNIMDINQSDLSIAISGISGPNGGTENKPVGLVYIACKFHSSMVVKKYFLKFDRLINRKITIYLALNMIRTILDEN